MCATHAGKMRRKMCEIKFPVRTGDELRQVASAYTSPLLLGGGGRGLMSVVVGACALPSA